MATPEDFIDQGQGLSKLNDDALRDDTSLLVSAPLCDVVGCPGAPPAAEPAWRVLDITQQVPDEHNARITRRCADGISLIITIPPVAARQPAGPFQQPVRQPVADRAGRLRALEQEGLPLVRGHRSDKLRQPVHFHRIERIQRGDVHSARPRHVQCGLREGRTVPVAATS